MINRKIDKYLDNFFHATNKALLLTGVRQISETYSIRQASLRIFDDLQKSTLQLLQKPLASSICVLEDNGRYDK